MRFLRGLCVGILGYFLYQFFGFLTLYGSPEYAIFMILGFLGMFLGPLYYWIIEPMRERRRLPIQSKGGKDLKQFLTQTDYQSSQQPHSQLPQQSCGKCGHPITVGFYCIKCGTRIMTDIK